LLQLMLDAETGQRGYLITGNEDYLVPYRESVGQIGATLDALRNAHMHDSAAVAKFALLSRATSRKLAEMDVTIKIKQSNSGETNWQSVVATDLGKQYMDEIRAAAAQLVSTANADLAVGLENVQASLQISRIGIALVVALALLAFQLYLRRSKQLIESSDREKRILADDKQRLEAMVSERTTRLTSLANHLQQVQEQERERLARELHDELGSLLTAAKLDVARVRSRLPETSTEAFARMQHLTETLNAGIALKRRIIEDLRPSSLTKLGLVPALEVLCREFQERANITVVSELEPVALSEEAALTVYRVVQESMTNVAKYANASEVTVTLKNYESYAELSVSDNGRGFDVAARANASYGIPGLRHRVEALHGAFKIESELGSGSITTVVVPTTATTTSDQSLSPER
jgi:signal transduction histidine kinase